MRPHIAQPLIEQQRSIRQDDLQRSSDLPHIVLSLMLPALLLSSIPFDLKRVLNDSAAAAYREMRLASSLSACMLRGAGGLRRLQTSSGAIDWPILPMVMRLVRRPRGRSIVRR